MPIQLREINDVPQDKFGGDDNSRSTLYRNHDPDFKKENVKGREIVKRFARMYKIELKYIE